MGYFRFKYILFCFIRYKKVDKIYETCKITNLHYIILNFIFMKQILKLTFEPKFGAFVISDDEVNRVIADHKVPIIRLPEAKEFELGLNVTGENPTIGFLLGREEGYYSLDYDYAKAIYMAGGRIQGLCYDSIQEQMATVDGLVLPGGSFVSPDEFYVTRAENPQVPSKRSNAYLEAIRVAEEQAIPVLGICAGAQMVAGAHGMKMYRDLKHSPIEHKSSDDDAHKVILRPNCLLQFWMGKKEFTVNSRHKEGMLLNNEGTDLEVYAVAPDGVPEAWGKMEDGILCVQWHPENLAVKGNKLMLSIYQWIVCESCNARDFKTFV